MKSSLLLLSMLPPQCRSMPAFTTVVRQSLRTKTTTARHAKKRKPYASIDSSGTVSSTESVAVIGGGVAGLSCASALTATGRFSPTVFDTGRLRPGGRCSSRCPGDPAKEGERNSVLGGSGVVVDHAAQILTVPPGDGFQKFRKQVDEWEDQGIVRKFTPGTVCDISNPRLQTSSNKRSYDTTRIQLRKQEGDKYFGVNGMHSIPLAMAESQQVEQDVWVSPNNGVKLINTERGDKWQVKAKGKLLGQFDRLVIAHNGKCADRLMSKTPATDLHRLLKVNFNWNIKNKGNPAERMTLNSLYSLTFAVDGSAAAALATALPPDEFTAGCIKNHPNLRFIASNTRKHGSHDDGATEVWTVLSSAKFGKAFKGSQENLPDDLVAKVTGLLYESIEQALVLPEGSLRGRGAVRDSRLQLWGAGVPLNTWVATDDTAGGFIYDGDYGVGVCGDWLLESSLAGAWESGRRLAEHMASDPDETSGLEGKFQASRAVDKAGIGSL